MITIDQSIPKMTGSSGETLTIREMGSSFAIAYYLAGANEMSGVVQFDDLRGWSYGYPNDEGLDAHPLYGLGLELYQFHVTPLAGHGERCWIATFHDGTLTVYAGAAHVLAKDYPGSPGDAMESIYGQGESRVLQ